MQITSILDAAKKIAIAAHRDQMYGTKPYIYHLEEVFNVCKRHSLPEYVQVAAYLHDVVEDTDIQVNELCNKFGYEIATLVYSVTDVNGANRKERKLGTYPKILSHPFGVHLKLADRIANVKSCIINKNLNLLNMYRKEANEFESKLRTPGVAEPLWAELDMYYNKQQ